MTGAKLPIKEEIKILPPGKVIVMAERDDSSRVCSACLEGEHSVSGWSHQNEEKARVQ